MTQLDTLISLCLFSVVWISSLSPVLCLPARCYDTVPPQRPSCGIGGKYFYFDSMKGRCTSIDYYGCGKTLNIFKRKEDCQYACSCHLEPDWGTYCGRNYKIKYYYEDESGLCRKFWYSGCGGNHNRFAKKSECKRVCSGKRSLKSQIDDLTQIIKNEIKDLNIIV